MLQFSLQQLCFSTEGPSVHAVCECQVQCVQSDNPSAWHGRRWTFKRFCSEHCKSSWASSLDQLTSEVQGCLLLSGLCHACLTFAALSILVVSASRCLCFQGQCHQSHHSPNRPTSLIDAGPRSLFARCRLLPQTRRHHDAFHSLNQLHKARRQLPTIIMVFAAESAEEGHGCSRWQRSGTVRHHARPQKPYMPRPPPAPQCHEYFGSVTADVKMR